MYTGLSPVCILCTQDCLLSVMCVLRNVFCGVYKAMESTQMIKATGLDGIPAEVLKLECFSDQLLEM